MSDATDKVQDQRDALILAALPNVPFDGWGPVTLRRAAESVGLDADAATRLFPGGAPAAVAHFMVLADRLMVADLAAMDLTGKRTPERVALAIRTRLQRWHSHREAIRRAIAIAPLPTLAGEALRGWYRTVDAIWRAAGDKSVDFSFYTKRALLAGVYAATLFYWLDDQSEDSAATWAFLDRRLADVARIPKVRGRLEKAALALPNPVRMARRVFARAEREWGVRGGGSRAKFR